ncbi:hypothetical protein RZS08_66510, partial [Arthrospira platensis SPKY1]|nr:hypothetical protein [Arthrospira platensis SPKY1]
EAPTDFLESALPLHCHFAPAESFGTALLKTTNGLPEWEALASGAAQADEEEVFAAAGLPFVEPELRDNPKALEWARSGALPKLIEAADLQGLLHAHSTYSD